MPLLPVLRKSPFARLLFFYAAGISAAGAYGSRPVSLLVLAVILPVFWSVLWGIVSLSRNYHTGWISGSFASLILFLCGIWAMQVQNGQDNVSHSIPSKTATWRIRILDLPEARKNSIRTTARVIESMDENHRTKQDFMILVYLQQGGEDGFIGVGSELEIHAALEPIPPPGNPGEFDYRRYLSSRHIYRQAFVKEGCWKVREASQGLSLRVVSALMRKRLLRSFKMLGLDAQEYGLVTALTLGYKDDLDARTKQVFSRAGVMHIMALSGFNVGIIALVFGYLLGLFDRHPAAKAGKTVIIILVLWLFAVVTGLSPSVTRATVMISFVLTGKLLRRPVNTYNILFASAFVLLAASPGMLQDVSFQLSFAAVTGLILYQPILYGILLFRNSIMNKIWQLFTLTCAAQLATLPITLYYFHQFPVYFWLTNLYVVPLVSVIVCISGIYLAVAFIKPAIVLFAKILTLLLKALFLSVSFVEKLPYSLISGVNINASQAVILSLMVVALALFFLFRQARWLSCFMAFLILFLTLHTVSTLKLDRQKLCIVGNLRGTSAIGMISGRKAVMLLSDDWHSNQSQLNYAFGNFWISHGVKPVFCKIDKAGSLMKKDSLAEGVHFRSGWRGNNTLINYGTCRLVVLRDGRFYRYKGSKPLSADILVVSAGMQPRPSRVREELQVRLIILDSSVKNHQIIQWKKAAVELGISCYSVSEKGAYVFVPGSETVKY
jgi:competence protein ComEC